MLDNTVDLSKRISVQVKDATIQATLETLDKNAIQYEIIGNQIVLKSKRSNTLNQKNLFSKKKIIKGTILDEYNTPLIGANVIEVGTTNGTVTDIDGNYSLEINEDANILISYIGYLEQKLKYNGKGLLNIILKEDKQALDELVVIGYGVTRKRDLSGAITSLKTDDIKAGLVTSTAQLLKGRAAGVLVKQNTSEPGGGISIRIRGASSISSNNEPLYVIDGFQTDLGNQVNPGDIQSIEILKDAAATAIYGARGANGVVLITTKKGKKGVFNVNYSYDIANKEIVNPWDLMNAQDVIGYNMKVWEENGSSGNPPYTEDQLKYKGEGTDWLEATTRAAMTQNHQLLISGGGDKTTMSISASYLDDLGVLQNTNFDRFTGRMNLGYKLNDKVRFGSNMYIARSNKNFVNMGTNSANNNTIYSIFLMSPLVTETGADVFGKPGKKPGIFSELNDVDFENVANNMYVTLFGEADILKSLTARVQYTYSNNNSKNQQYYPKSTNIGLANNGLASIKSYKDDAQQIDALLTWHKTFADKHNIKLLAGTTYSKNTSESIGMQGFGFSTDEFSFNNIGAAQTIQSISSSKGERVRTSFFSRAEYILNQKYVLNLSVRADGASNFGEGNKWGYFPSGSAAWQLGDESFMEFIKPLFSSLKLRASYGFTGNDGIGSYLSQRKFATTDVYLGGGSIVKGMYPANPENKNLKWETTSQVNLGVDFTLLDSRIEVNFDYYEKITKDLLNPISVSTSTGGFKTMMGNNGKIQNKGFELFIKSNNISNINFDWSTTLNLSRNKNMVLALNEGEDRFESISPHGWYNREEYVVLREGSSLSSLYGYVFDGIIQTGETYSAQPTSVPGDPKFKDLDGDGTITINDREIIGDGSPDITLGLGNSFRLHDFDFSFFFDGSIGNNLLNLSRVVMEDNNRLLDSMDRWTQTNPSNEVPRNGYQKNSGVKYGSYINSRFVEDASFLRLQNIELGYSLPLNKWGNMSKYIKNMRVVVGAQNLFTITKYTGFNPEVSTNGGSAVSQGLDFSSYPAYKTFNFGAKIIF